LHDNLLKFDILGHDDPTSLKMLYELTNIDPITIPFHDENVMKLFSSLEPLNLQSEQILGETTGAIGLPEFGTEFVRTILKDTTPKSFGDLVRISGLSHGTDVYLNNAKNLITEAKMQLKEVIACRDDIMIYLIERGVDSKIAFEIMENVRKGKKLVCENKRSVLEDKKLDINHYANVMEEKNIPK
jgi:DNA polymerase-3 subunit alpha (Gram-positive type)